MYIQRKLFPHNGSWHLNNGFFVKLSGKHADFYNKEVTDFSNAIKNNNCLILVGESGVGKTEYLRHHFEELSQPKIWIDLKRITDENSIDNEIFNKKFKALYKNNDFVYIFMDGLDEALFDFNKVYFSILSKLRVYNHNKIKLILSCRTYYFPTTFEIDLKEYFGIKSENNIVFDLTPFTKEDVQNCIERSGLINVNAFFEKVDRCNLTPFLAKPITLFSIIEQFKNNSLDESHSMLIILQIKKLLMENNLFRVEQSKFSKNYSSKIVLEQKLYLIGRLALLLIVRSKSSFFIGDVDKTPDYSINIEDFNSGIDIFNGEVINVSNIDFGDLFTADLFSTNGNGVYEFSHNLYKEFLSAWYIYKQECSLDDKFNSISINSRIIPIFTQTASWLAQFDDEFFNLIIEQNAHILLKTEVVFNDIQNKQLIEHAISLLKEEKIGLYDTNRRKLIHSDLSEQLNEIIKRSDNNDQIKFFIIDLINYGGLTDLQGYLYSLTTPENNISIRDEAIECLSIIGNKYYKDKLCRQYDEYKLELKQKDFDPDDNLRASYLMLLLSNNYPVHKILDLITPKKNLSYYGGYERFLTDFVNSLNQNNIYILLEWIIANNKNWVDEYERRSLSKDVLEKSCNFIKDKKVANTVAKMLYEGYKKHHFTSEVQLECLNRGDDNSKILFLEILFNYITLDNISKSNYELTVLYDGFLRNEDFVWLCEQYQNEKTKSKKNILKEFITKIKNYRFPDKLTERTQYLLPVYMAFNSNEYLVTEFGKFNTRIYKYKKTSWEKKQESQKKEKIDPQEHIRKILKRTATNIDFASYLVEYLTLLPDSKYIGDFSLSPSKYPAWEATTEDNKIKILKAFYQFLKEKPAPKYEEYSDGGKFQHHWYILAFVPEIISQGIATKEEVKPYIKAWAPFIFLIPKLDNDYEIEQKFVNFFFNLIPNELIKNVLELIKNKSNIEHPSILNGLLTVNNEQLNHNLYLLLNNKPQKLSSEYIAHILKYLFQKKYNGTLVLGHNLLDKFKKNEKYFMDIAALSVCFGSDLTWQKVHKWISGKRKYGAGRSLISKFTRNAPYNKGVPLFSNISQSTLADYYIWLYKAYPYSEEEKKYQNKKGLCTMVTDADYLSDFRRYILNKIKDDGCTQTIEKISNKLPELSRKTWFKRFSFEVSGKEAEKNFLNKDPILLIQKQSSNFRTSGEFPEILDLQNKEKNKNDELIIYVEAEDDVLFYSTVYKNIIEYYPGLLPVNPILKFKATDYAGKNKDAVIAQVNAIRSTTKTKERVFGIVDKDRNDKTSHFIKVAKSRYAIENYLVEPLFQLYMLRQQISSSSKKKYSDLTNNLPDFDIDNLNRISDTELLNKIIKNILNEVSSNDARVKGVVGQDEYAYFKRYTRKVKYINNIELKLERWICDMGAKQVFNLFKILNPDMDIKTMIEVHYKKFKLIPEDLLICFQDILCYDEKFH